ncbi:MAG: AlpA family phage regulatory protein [Gammaproteobacteria bacterium]|nr:AlpA family phage regulatory protein [Gammaproteobacteria bacterium]
MRLPQVTDVTTLSKASIYRLLRDRKFPAPVRIGERRVAWRLSDVMGWLDQRAGVTV